MSELKPSEGLFFQFTTRKPIAILMVVLAVSVFGLVSFRKLPVNLMPEITYPTVTVRTEYPGAAPADVEDRISRRIEQSLAVIPGLVQISSISRAEASDVILEFTWDTNMKLITQDIREKLGQTFLPDDAEKPTLLRYDPTLDPILRIGIYGPADLFTLRRIAEEDIQRELETLSGVAAVKVKGGLEEEIRVEIDEKLLTELELDIQQVSLRLQSENINLAGGRIKEGETEYLVRTLNEFKDISEIRELVVAQKGSALIKMKDIGRVFSTHKEREVITRIRGQESVEIDIYREAGANIVKVAEGVKDRLFGTQVQQAYVRNLENLKRIQEEKARRGADSAAVPPGTRKEDEEAGKPSQEDPGEAKKEDADEQKKEDRGEHKKKEDAEKLKAEKLKKERMKQRMEALRKRALHENMTDFLAFKLPTGVKATVLSDQSRFIQSSIDEVKSAAVLGGIFAVLVLYFFLRSARSTFLIATSIPISVIATFAPMYLFNVSLNIMSLGGLALGVGMLVDNSIVVLESIFRRREEGDDTVTAAQRGVHIVGRAVLASTLTTIAVFFPIVFVEGIAGQVFRDQALTVVFSLIASLLVAFFFIPMLASRQFQRNPSIPRCPQKRSGLLHFSSLDQFWERREWSRVAKKSGTVTKVTSTVLHPLYLYSSTGLHIVLELVGKVLYFAFLFLALIVKNLYRLLAILFGTLLRPFLFLFNHAYNAVAGLYPQVLSYALSLRLPIVLAAGLLLYLSFQFSKDLGSELIPEVHQGEFTVEIFCPVGYPLEKTDRVTQEFEKVIRSVNEVKSFASVVGVEKESISSAEEGEHTSKITLTLAKGPAPALREMGTKKEMRERFVGLPASAEVDGFKFSNPTLFSYKTPIEVEVKGYNLDRLRILAKRVEEAMRTVAGLKDIKSNLQRGNPEIQITFDRLLLIKNGLSISQVAQIVRNKVLGDVPTKFSLLDRKIDILVKAREEDVRNLEDLRNLTINPGSPTPIPLRDVAELGIREGPSEIRHLDQQRGAVVTANLSGRDLASVSNEIRQKLRELEQSEEAGDFTFSISGQNQEREVSQRSLFFALILAVFLVYIVMASQFESLLHPLIIMGTIPLALVGVVFTLWALSLPLSIVVFIGLIMLAGIVVNNAIVLVDCINRFRRQGMEIRSAIIEAGKIRFRPILMTTATTVLGLVPMTGVLGGLEVLNRLPIPLGMGEGTEIRAPMAITVISGLISSTVLTLIVIPVVYSLVESLSASVKRLAGFGGGFE